MALAGGGSRRSKKSRKARAAKAHDYVLSAEGKSRRTTARDLARAKTVRRSIANSKKKKISKDDDENSKACAAFVRDIENAQDAASNMKSKKLRVAAHKAINKAQERALKCFAGRFDP